MRDISPQSPEARRKRLASMRAAFGTEVEEKLKPKVTALEVVKRVGIGVYTDGFIHAEAGRSLKPPMAGPLNPPRGAWVRSLWLED